MDAETVVPADVQPTSTAAGFRRLTSGVALLAGNILGQREAEPEDCPRRHGEPRDFVDTAPFSHEAKIQDEPKIQAIT